MKQQDNSNNTDLCQIKIYSIENNENTLDRFVAWTELDAILLFHEKVKKLSEGKYYLKETEKIINIVEKTVDGLKLVSDFV